MTERPMCRPVTVEVDGEPVHALVRGTREPTEGDLAIVAAAARELRRRAAEDPEMFARQDAARERLAARRRAWEAEHG